MTLSMLSKTCLEILQFAPRARNQSSCRSLRALGKSISVPRSRSSSSSHGQGNRNGVEVKSSKSEFDSHKIDIDRSELLGGGGFTSGTSKSTMVGLARELEQLIKASGPISVADYMLYALQHPKHGYYIREEKKIGSGGDFVTAPEISQVFGELLCVWCVATWTGMGSPERVRMVELGPGKGTLMKDFLRAASRLVVGRCFSHSTPFHCGGREMLLRQLSQTCFSVSATIRGKMSRATIHGNMSRPPFSPIQSEALT
ncbi:unnamed protein product [Discosporangium mesarthrocarpum]